MKNTELILNKEGLVESIRPDANGLLSIPKEACGFGPEALLLCEGVTAIAVEAGNPFYRAEGGCLIRKDTETVVFAGRNAVIPAGVQALGCCALSWDDDRTAAELDPLHLPEGLRRIEYRALAVRSENKIRIVVPASVESVGLMALMMQCGGDHVCEVTFLGNPALEAGVFGTKEELLDVDWDVLHQMPACIYTQPNEILVRASADSTVAAYCAKYGIPFENAEAES